MKLSCAAVLAGFLLVSAGWGIAHSEEPIAWQPSPGHTQIPIWPGAVPDVQPVPGPETHTEGAVTNVTRPTMTVYSPTGKNTGAAIIVQNEDDHVDSIEDALSYYVGLKAANVPVELHAYAQGGHAFGLRPSKLAVSAWPRLVETWLGTIGMIQ
jgi:hypothetical protein